MKIHNHFILTLVATGLLSVSGWASHTPPPVADRDGTIHYGPATHTVHHGIHVLNLRGTEEEMARQHGAFSAHLADQGALAFFSEVISRSIQKTYLVRDYPALGPVLQSWVRFHYFRPLRSSIPEDTAAVYRAFSETSGFAYDKTLDALVAPDVGQLLTSRIFKGEAPPQLGCSSFVSHHGPWLHARNLDYEGTGIFDRNPAVIYFHPTQPGAQSYVAFTSLGLHTAGVTGYNESGIGLGLHQIHVNDGNRSGTPILSITHRVVQKARTLDEAIHILKNSSFAGAWTVVLSSWKERRAVAVEISAGGVQVRPMDKNRLAATNHVFSDEKKKKEFSIGYQYSVGTRLRLKNLDFILEEARVERSRFDVQSAIDLLSTHEYFPDYRDRTQEPARYRSLMGVPAVLSNIQSLVLSPDEGQVVFAYADRGIAAPYEGQYFVLPLDFEKLRGPTPMREILESMPQPLTRSASYPEKLIQAHTLYRHAFRTNDPQKTLQVLSQVAELRPEDSAFQLMLALAYFKVISDELRSGKADSGTFSVYSYAIGRILHRALKQSDLSPYHRSLAFLFLGRVADLRGERAAALTWYQKVETHFSSRLASARASGLKDPYEWSDTHRLTVSWMTGDVFNF